MLYEKAVQLYGKAWDVRFLGAANPTYLRAAAIADRQPHTVGIYRDHGIVVLALPLIQAAANFYNQMLSFSDAGIEAVV